MEAFRLILSYGAVKYFFSAPILQNDKIVSYERLPWYFSLVTCILILGIGYLFGSFNFATYISNKKYKDDIRQHGSGNAGMTNMMRTYGTKAAALTLLGDVMKTAVAIFIGYLLMGKTGGYFAGLGAVIGHTWPLYYNFKGGKGVATAIAMILCTEPIVGLLLILVFVVIVATTKFISLGSIMGALMYPVLLHNFGSIEIERLICCLAVVALLVFNHRTNMIRLLNGQENKFSFKKSK